MVSDLPKFVAILIYLFTFWKQWKDHLPEKHRYRDIWRREKTGTLNSSIFKIRKCEKYSWVSSISHFSVRWRFKSKGKAGITSCASLDMYFNHQMGNKTPRNDTFSTPQLRQHSTPARCSSTENDSVKKVCLSTGLSNKGEVFTLKSLFTGQCYSDDFYTYLFFCHLWIWLLSRTKFLYW